MSLWWIVMAESLRHLDLLLLLQTESFQDPPPHKHYITTKFLTLVAGQEDRPNQGRQGFLKGSLRTANERDVRIDQTGSDGV